MTSGDTVGLGLVGAGGFASFLAGSAASLPSVALRAVADPRLDAAVSLAGSYGACATDSWRDLLDDDGVGAVVLTVPAVALFIAFQKHFTTTDIGSGVKG